ncbi:DNA-(apurinic or apyrimidinic site) lyase [Metamycoplasma subdolum]|uniref:DNA-(Apurinic or apyrimidinic site) lyase n=1 Tax=Metamycoplasma subdolum TaxID=92407 RepID=A0A3L9ZY01_9BACT|nr:DNA-formamidopyrimidine glycosylase [Metamycoplasma subdolum]RMA77593.1 DNA-(apurinic or apyrimidinic site) lyase [Metamycoplasma subdolum]WPB50387.1 DNA-formamidopyrimidine glycosylase [Metamycoplasma subdolum]
MPELAEVRVVCDALNKTIKNKKIVEIKIFKSKLFKEKSVQEFKEILTDKTILKVENKGKHIIIYLNENLVLLSHLRMEGKYRFYNKGEENFDTHLICTFHFKDGSYLNYLDSRMFGTFHLRNLQNYDKILPLSKVANEPKNVDINNLYEKIKKSTSSIKTKLLDQTLVSGIGNIYIDEALFLAKVHPETKANRISRDELKEIIDFSAEVMQKSYEYGGTTLFSYESMNSLEGKYQELLKVHNDKIKNCSICKSKIEKIKVNGRMSYFCPNCQKRK